MENLDRLTSSVTQVELLVASLRRENRDLAIRLAQAAGERRDVQEQLRAKEESYARALSLAQAVKEADPEMEADLAQAQAEAAGLRAEMDEEAQAHQAERQRYEALIRQLEAQALAGEDHETLPVASAEALQEAEARIQALETVATELKSVLAERESRINRMEIEILEQGRHLADAQLRLAEAAAPDEVARWQTQLAELESLRSKAAEIETLATKLEEEKAGMRIERRELAAFAKERANLRRRVQELLATLESVRLG